MPGTIGCVDGTLVSMVRHKQHEERYYCRKGYRARNAVITPVSLLDHIHMMVPCSNPGPKSKEEYYNNLHAAARNTAERTIGILKGRFSFWTMSIWSSSGVAAGSNGSLPVTASSSEDEDEDVAPPVPKPSGSTGRRNHPNSDELRSAMTVTKESGQVRKFRCRKDKDSVSFNRDIV
ncbi:hypothetical protein HF086_004744 [Spodoptera exigua]|uniref:DDE Tnp4 domain-containing protein n=1 Tax=Spodoptera exigua TaxID=7107 RepID=A0A922SCM4_SPOEX|nr:hypothetical protein HF086_004744 [Spodoptera exigua]